MGRTLTVTVPVRSSDSTSSSSVAGAAACRSGAASMECRVLGCVVSPGLGPAAGYYDCRTCVSGPDVDAAYNVTFSHPFLGVQVIACCWCSLPMLAPLPTLSSSLFCMGMV